MPANGLTLEVDVQLAEGRRGAHALVASLTVEPGVSVLFGASGAGKTSLLCAVAGLLRPDAGRIAVGEHVLFDEKRRVDVPPERRKVALVFQSLALFPHLNALANVAYGIPRDEPRREIAAAGWLERMRVGYLSTRRPHTFSGGEAQRVALARALASRPRVLLLDEAFSAMDEPLRLALGNEVAQLMDELAIPCLLVTHDRSEGQRLSSRVFELQEGRVRQLTPSRSPPPSPLAGRGERTCSSSSS